MSPAGLLVSSQSIQEQLKFILNVFFFIINICNMMQMGLSFIKLSAYLYLFAFLRLNLKGKQVVEELE